MSTMLQSQITTGDVIEMVINGEWATALVLLATDEAIILDLCDGSTPLVSRADELGEYRLFDAAF
jgi:hypothetical protein